MEVDEPTALGLATMKFDIGITPRTGITVLNDTEVIIVSRESDTKGHSIKLNTVSTIIASNKVIIYKINGEKNEFICKQSFIWSAAKL